MATSEIKEHMKASRLVIGTKLTMKQLKLGRISKIFLSSNCPQNVSGDVDYYCNIAGCTVERTDVPNEELGAICKKPFSVSMIGVLKQ